MKITALSLIAVLGLTSLGMPARASLLAYYNFDNSANTFEDSSSSGNHITGNAGTNPVWGSAVGFNGSGAFDYSDDRLIAPINVNPGGMPQMTWGAWVRTDSLAPGLRKVLGHDNGGWDRTLGLDDRAPNGTFRYSAFTGDNPVNASGPVEGTPGPTSITAWSFIAASHNQTTLQLTMYVDLDASTTGDALVAITEPAGFGLGFNTFAIGGIRPDNASEAWDGAIDQVFVFDEELSNAQLTQFRNQGFVIPEPSSALLAGMALALLRRRRQILRVRVEQVPHFQS